MPDPDLRAVVVDDEPLAREEICYLLEEMGGVAVVAQAGNGPDARGGCRRTRARSRVPGCADARAHGFRGGQASGRAGPPVAIVFVTAYDQHAIEAFEVNAVDYLLKPVDSGRLETAVQRVRQRRSTARAV